MGLHGLLRDNFTLPLPTKWSPAYVFKHSHIFKNGNSSFIADPKIYKYHWVIRIEAKDLILILSLFLLVM
jgi:hypothetical protein